MRLTTLLPRYRDLRPSALLLAIAGLLAWPAPAADAQVTIGPGYTDVSPHQLVRTAGDRVYVAASTCDSYPCTSSSQTVRMWRAAQTGLPTSFTRVDAAHEPTDTGTVGIAIDAANVIHVVWQHRNGASPTRIRYARFDTGSDTWGAVEDVEAVADGVSDTVGQGDQYCAIALDAGGTPHVAYLFHDGTRRRLAYRARQGGAWTARELIDDVAYASGHKAWHPNIAFDSAGRRVFAWAAGDFNANSNGRILVRVKDTDGTLGATQTLDGGTAKVGIDQSTSLMAANGLLHVTWILGGAGTGGDEQGEYIRYAWAAEAKTPSFAQNNPGGGVQESHNPSLGPGPSGRVRIYGHGSNVPDDNGLYYFEGNGGSASWASRTPFSQGAFDASVSTRWSQYHQALPERLDVAFWNQDYPNVLLYLGSGGGAGGVTPTVSISSTSTPESSSAALTVSLSAAAAQTVTVRYATANGSAVAPGDYAAASGTLSFSPGVTALPLSLSIVNDTAVEADEAFTVTLSTPVNATLGTASGTVTIRDDDVAPPVASADAYQVAAGTTLQVPAPGVLANDGLGPAGGSAQLQQTTAHGTLALAADGGFTYTPAAGYVGSDGFTYRAVNAAGPGPVAAVQITVSAPTQVQAPTGLRIQNISGSLVTLRWVAPALGPAPTSYLVEGGVAPGVPLVAVPTGSAATAIQFEAPATTIYLRVLAVGAGGSSTPSNEISLQVGTALPPSAPAALTAAVNGSELSLSWLPTFTGPVPTGATLDVNGGQLQVPLPAIDTLSVAGVTPGTYTLAVRSTGPGGSSATSAPVVASVPGTCPGPPQAPPNFVAWVQAGAARVVWDPPASGPAATSYLLSLDGYATFSMTQRIGVGVLPPGTYTFRLRAVNACGTGPEAPAQVVVVP